MTILLHWHKHGPIQCFQGFVWGVANIKYLGDGIASANLFGHHNYNLRGPPFLECSISPDSAVFFESQRSAALTNKRLNKS